MSVSKLSRPKKNLLMNKLHHEDQGTQQTGPGYKSIIRKGKTQLPKAGKIIDSFK